jgi:predicted ribonuclease YlaK
LGKIKPYKDDPYQALAIDSFLNNKITLIKGPAGTGKSFLSLGYLFHLLGNNKIDKIIIFCNTVATKGAARLGFYPGTREEKLMDSQIGNFLSSKLGDRSAVEQLMQQERLILLPMADLRGYDTSGMRAGVYITEAQNLDISLMKLALQRIGEDSICIIDGDQKTQVDDVNFEGSNNGMRRLSKIFKGSSLYGEVELKKIHRSKLAELAERL